jgi:hypothetical protein
VEFPSVEEPPHLVLERFLLVGDEVKPVVDDLPHLRVKLPPLHCDRHQCRIIWLIVDVSPPVTNRLAKLVKIPLLCQLFELVNLLLCVPLLAHELHAVFDLKSSFQHLFHNRPALVDILYGLHALRFSLPLLESAPQSPAQQMVDCCYPFGSAFLVAVASDTQGGHVASQVVDVQLMHY